MRTARNPLEVWVDTSDPKIFFMVLEKRPPNSDTQHEMWAIIISSPDDGITQDELYASSIGETATLVWSEGDGPLPTRFHIEEEEEEE